MESHVLDIDTSRRRIVDLTDEVRSFCGAHGDGLCNVFVPHATAGVAIIETGAGSDDDLIDALERLLPRDDRAREIFGVRLHRFQAAVEHALRDWEREEELAAR